MLEDPHRLVGAEYGDGAGESNALCAFGGRGEDDGGRGGDVVGAVMFADAEDVEANLVGEFDFLYEIADALRGAGLPAGLWVVCGVDEGIDAQFHEVHVQGSARGEPRPMRPMGSCCLVVVEYEVQTAPLTKI